MIHWAHSLSWPFAVERDINDDGKIDLLATNASPSTLSVMLNNGDATFKTPTTTPTLLWRDIRGAAP